MAISDPGVARRALDALSTTDVRFAVLHSEGIVAQGLSASDVDIVVDRPPQAVLRTALAAFDRSAVYPILVWPYDVGGAASVFFASRDARGGAQIDMLFDPRAEGKEGIRSDVLLDGVVAGDRWERVAPIDELIYLVRKRQRKGQVQQLLTIVETLRELPRPEVSSRLMALAPRKISRGVLSIISSEPIRGTLPTPVKPTLYRVRTAMRLARRLVSPIGIWASVSSESVATALASRLSGFLPHVDIARAPLANGYVWWVRRVTRVRWRPGVILSWPNRFSFPRPDIVLSGDVHSAALELVTLMKKRSIRDI